MRTQQHLRRDTGKYRPCSGTTRRRLASATLAMSSDNVGRQTHRVASARQWALAEHPSLLLGSFESGLLSNCPVLSLRKSVMISPIGPSRNPSATPEPPASSLRIRHKPSDDCRDREDDECGFESHCLSGRRWRSHHRDPCELVSALRAGRVALHHIAAANGAQPMLRSRHEPDDGKNDKDDEPEEDDQADSEALPDIGGRLAELLRDVPALTSGSVAQPESVEAPAIIHTRNRTLTMWINHVIFRHFNGFMMPLLL